MEQFFLEEKCKSKLTRQRQITSYLPGEEKRIKTALVKNLSEKIPKIEWSRLQPLPKFPSGGVAVLEATF